MKILKHFSKAIIALILAFSMTTLAACDVFNGLFGGGSGETANNFHLMKKAATEVAAFNQHPKNSTPFNITSFTVSFIRL